MNKFLKQLALLDSQKLLIAAAMVGGLYYYMFYNDGAIIEGQIKTLNHELAAEKEKEKDTILTLAEEKRMKQAVVILSEQYQTISKRLPTQLSEHEINGALQGYARETRVRIKASRPGKPEKMEIVQEVPWEITLEGKFPEIMKFISHVSSSERLTRLKSVVLSPVADAEAGNALGNATLLRFEGVVVGYKLSAEEQKGSRQ